MKSLVPVAFANSVLLAGGKGKSGGYRIISAYLGEDIPVYLLAALSKGERANFNASEIAAFRKITAGLKQLWRERSR